MHPKPKEKKRVVRKRKTTIVVGNLPDACIDDDLHSLFSNYGKVTDCDVVNNYGYVRMKTVEQAQEAVKKLNNYNLNGSCISVENAKSKEITGTKLTPKAPSAVFNSSLQKFTFNKLVMNLISKPNIASCLSVTPDYQDYEKEFDKFLDFVENLEGLEKLQLGRAIFPLFVHFYLNVVGDRKNANSFYRTFIDIFHSSNDYKDVLEELYKIKSKEEIDEHSYFKNFRIKKYVLKISFATLKTLESFLNDIESKALWQTFSLYFYYEESDVEFCSEANLKKKAKKSKRPIKKLRQLNYEKCFSIGGKKKTGKKETILKKRPAAEDHNLKKKQKSECLITEDLINVDEFNTPILITAVDWFESDTYAMDVNQDATELCFTYGDTDIFISPLTETDILRSINYKLQEDHMDHMDFSPEFEGKKITFRAPVRAVKYFPNNPYLFLAASKIEIAKVNTAANTVTMFNDGYVSEIWDIDINSVGSLCCSANHDMTCRLWNVDMLSMLRIYVGHKNIVTTVKFHPNGIYLLSGSNDFDIRLWNIENALCLRCLTDHKAPVTLLTCCPDKKTIASADSDGIVKLWDIEENIKIFDIQCYKDNVYDGSEITSMCFNGENFLGLSNNRGVIRIWDVRQPKTVFEEHYPEHFPAVLKINNLETWSVVLRKKEKGVQYCDFEEEIHEESLVQYYS